MTRRILASTLLTLAASSLAFSALADTPRSEGAQKEKGPGHFMLKRYDADGDGTISLQEFRAAGDALFERLDADGDGRISAEEFAQSARQWSERAHDRPHSKRRAEASDSQSERRRRGNHRGHEHWFARMDADGDGYITKAEFDDARMARFNALDVNGNGVIDADELPAGRGGKKGRGWHHRGGAPTAE